MNFRNRRSNTPPKMPRQWFLLREKIVERLKQDDLIRVAKLEFDCVMPIAAMELNGFYLDEERWREQLEKVKKEQDVVGLDLQKMLSAGVAQASLFGIAEINLNSQASGYGRAEKFRRSDRRNDARLAIAAACRRISGRCQTPRISRRGEISERVSAKIFWNLSNPKRAEFTPIFARSAHRREVLAAQNRTSSKYRTKKNTADVSVRPKAENLLPPIIRRSNCGSWRIFQTTKTLSKPLFPAKIFTRQPPHRFLMSNPKK